MSDKGDRFYTSKRWRDLRAYMIAKSGGRCARCGRVFSDTSKLIVHHKEELEGDDYDDPSKSLNIDNLEVVCIDCHNEIHDRFYSKRNIVIVYGAPKSGKKTFVKASKRFDDICIDMDAIKSALSLSDIGDSPDTITMNAYHVRDFILNEEIRHRKGDWRTAWVIGCMPRRYERDSFKVEFANLNPTFRFIDAPKETCLSRCETDEERGFVERWFKDYER